VNNLGQSWVFWAVLLSGLTVLFALPVIIAMVRGVKGLGYVVLFTLFGLVTFGAGWLGALILAVCLPRPRRRWYTAPPHNPPMGRTWGLRGQTPVVRVTGAGLIHGQRPGRSPVRW
jgi:hypothetical protein